jgi:hypothetical protein
MVGNMGEEKAVLEREMDITVPSKEHEASASKHWLVAVMPRVLAFIFMVLLGLWIHKAEGGMRLRDVGFVESNLFGYHALLMAFFVVIFMQESLLAWSAPIFTSHVHKKAFHVLCHVVGLIFAILGVVAIVKYKKLSPEPIVFPFFTCYSPHSWTAIVFWSLWGIQIFCKLAFTLPITYHRFLGNCVYGVGLAVCAMGLQDMQSSDLAYSTPPMDMADMAAMNMTMSGYYPNSVEARLASAGSIVLVFLGMATFFTQVAF